MKVLSKNLLIAIAFSLPFSLSSFSPHAIAQNSECFMLDANGNPIDLRHLCGGAPNSANTSTIKTRTSINSNNVNSFIVPIKRRVHGTPVIDVQFNDKYIFEMLFDTGATMTVITPSMAQTLEIQPTGILPFQTASHDIIYFKTANINSVSTGNLISDNLNIAVAPSLEMGLLGQNFYEMYDITIKYDTIEFRKR